MLLDPAYAATQNPHAFAGSVLALHRQLTGAAAFGRAQLPWPRALGTPPWAVARAMATYAGVRYRTTLVPLPRPRPRSSTRCRRPSPPAARCRSTSAPWLPRHVVLAVAPTDRRRAGLQPRPRHARRDDARGLRGRQAHDVRALDAAVVRRGAGLTRHRPPTPRGRRPCHERDAASDDVATPRRCPRSWRRPGRPRRSGNRSCSGLLKVKRALLVGLDAGVLLGLLVLADHLKDLDLLLAVVRQHLADHLQPLRLRRDLARDGDGDRGGLTGGQRVGGAAEARRATGEGDLVGWRWRGASRPENQK